MVEAGGADVTPFLSGGVLLEKKKKEPMTWVPPLKAPPTDLEKRQEQGWRSNEMARHKRRRKTKRGVFNENEEKMKKGEKREL